MTTKPLTPEQRAMRSRLAAFARWGSVTDRAAATKPGTDGLLAKFERQIDPNGTLDPQARLQLALTARRAHMQRLALASSKARQAKKGTTH